jgi:hypothetical protein
MHSVPQLDNRSKCDVEGAESTFASPQHLLGEKCSILLVEMESPQNHRELTRKFPEIGHRCSDPDDSRNTAVISPPPSSPTIFNWKSAVCLGKFKAGRRCSTRCVFGLTGTTDGCCCNTPRWPGLRVASLKKVLRTLNILKASRARVGVVFHDVEPHAGNRLIDSIRRLAQVRTMRRALALADLAIFTVPPEKLSWLPAAPPHAAFIPVGPNLPIPPPEHSLQGPVPTIGVFSITRGEAGARETQIILAAVRHAFRSLARFASPFSRVMPKFVKQSSERGFGIWPSNSRSKVS